ncbi:MAG: DUF6364 family protein [Gemmatimonadota bacterium]
MRTLEASMKRAKNLLLDVDALANAEAYCKQHDTTLSLLVSDFLRWLPPRYYAMSGKGSTVVARLVGAAKKPRLISDTFEESAYRDRRKTFHEDWD